MHDYRYLSFPCIICGNDLERVTNDHEGQPSDGVMCSTHGNYGSTVYDPMDGSYLAFNICDPCILRAGRQGRLYETRSSRPVFAQMGKYRSIVGWEKVDRPYVQWHRGLPGDGAETDIDIFEPIPKGVTLNGDVESFRESARSWEE